MICLFMELNIIDNVIFTKYGKFAGLRKRNFHNVTEHYFLTNLR